MAVVEGDFGWSDIGSWDALAAVMDQDEMGNVTTGQALTIECSNCLVRSKEKRLVVFGMQDLVVVEGNDTIMICPRDRSQDVKRLVEIVGNA